MTKTIACLSFGCLFSHDLLILYGVVSRFPQGGQLILCLRNRLLQLCYKGLVLLQAASSARRASSCPCFSTHHGLCSASSSAFFSGRVQSLHNCSLHTLSRPQLLHQTISFCTSSADSNRDFDTSASSSAFFSAWRFPSTARSCIMTIFCADLS